MLLPYLHILKLLNDIQVLRTSLHVATGVSLCELVTTISIPLCAMNIVD